MKNIDFNKVYSLNNNYFLKHDTNRSLLLSRSSRRYERGDSEWFSMIHPEQAKILSFFTHGLKLNQTINKVSEYIGLEFDETYSIIEPFIENKEGFHTSISGYDFDFPEYIIVEESQPFKKYKPDNFDYEQLDFKTKRLFNGPTSITIMLSNRCVTDCVYCYADTKKIYANEITLNQIKNIVKQCKNLEIEDIGLIGGEIFSYKEWKGVFKCFAENNIQLDLLSTKKPLCKDDVAFLKEIGVNKLQISLDSANEGVLTKMLGVNKNYKQKISETLGYLQEFGIKTQIAVTVTNINSDLTGFIELLAFLSNYSNIENVDLGPAFYSLYQKSNFESWGVSREEYNSISDYVDLNKDKYTFAINVDRSFVDKKYFECGTGSNDFDGAECSSIRNHFFILPDGKVTICEQLYWHHEFIIGDINKNTISEVWNSQKSIGFNKLKISDFSEKSNCTSCGIFDNCHENVNKCWADILKAYGKDKWDYPDPRCKFAPKMVNNLEFIS